MAIAYASTAAPTTVPEAATTTVAPAPEVVNPIPASQPAPVEVSGNVDVVQHPGRQFGKGNDVELVVTGDFQWSKANVWGPDGILRVGTGWVSGDTDGRMVYGIGVNRIPGEYKWEVHIKKARKADHDGPTKVLTGAYISN